MTSGTSRGACSRAMSALLLTCTGRPPPQRSAERQPPRQPPRPHHPRRPPARTRLPLPWLRHPRRPQSPLPRRLQLPHLERQKLLLRRRRTSHLRALPPRLSLPQRLLLLLPSQSLLLPSQSLLQPSLRLRPPIRSLPLSPPRLVPRPPQRPPSR